MSRRRMFFNGFLLAGLMLSLLPAPALAARPPAPVVRHPDMYPGPTYAARPAAQGYDNGVVQRPSYANAADTTQVPEVGKAADPATLAEPGGAVTFTVGVTNTEGVTVTLLSLVDVPYGDLADASNALITGTTCFTGGTIAPAGGVYTCTFQADVYGDAGFVHTDTVTATVGDGVSSPASASADAMVTITDVEPTIAVSKAADPATLPEPGGMVTFTVGVANTSVETVTLSSLVDDVHGDLDGRGTCAVTQTIPVDGAYQCFFTATVSGNAGDVETDTVSAEAEDDEGNVASDDAGATVTVTDVEPTIAVSKAADPTEVPEPGGVVSFTVVVSNTGVEDVSLIALVDSIHGNLDDQGTCSVPQTIPADGAYRCSFTATVSGNAGDSETDTVTAAARDDELNLVVERAGATVTITDVEPTIAVSKAADPTVVPEPGGAVTFTVGVANTSVEAVTLSSLVDDVHGDLNGRGTCAVPQTIPVGGTYWCSFTATVSGNAGDSEADTVTAQAEDDEGNVASDDAGATVTFTDVEPGVEVSKTAAPDVIRAGDLVEFAVQIFNRSVEPVTLTDLDDSAFGSLALECGLPADIAVGGSFECVVSRTIQVDHTNTVTATVEDDEGNQAMDAADASVDVISPAIQMVTEASAGTAKVGEMITYTYRVENVGDVTLTDVRASDDRLGPIALGSSTLAEGGITTGTAVYSVAESDLPGPLTNTVVVTGTPPVGADVIWTDVVTVNVRPAVFLVYLPGVQKNAVPPAPDLVVEHIEVTSNSARVVIRNRGDAAVLPENEFWVDLYVDPDPVPTGVNQTWDLLCSEGAVWGVEGTVLPLAPGGAITLTVGGDYYWEEYSNFPGALSAGTPIYVQVDSADVETTYGAVLESHEMVGGPYNNVMGPVLSTPGTLRGGRAGPESPAGEGRPPTSIRRLPPRP